MEDDVQPCASAAEPMLVLPPFLASCSGPRHLCHRRGRCTPAPGSPITIVAMLACLATSLMTGLSALVVAHAGQGSNGQLGLCAAVPGRWLDGCPRGGLDPDPLCTHLTRCMSGVCRRWQLVERALQHQHRHGEGDECLSSFSLLWESFLIIRNEQVLCHIDEFISLQ